jgi:hypothetical protein
MERYYTYNFTILSTSSFRECNQFSDFSKSMIEFMKSNYYDPYIAQYIPKKAYKVKLKMQDFYFFNETADLNKFDKIIDELEPGILRLPVLIKVHQTEC